MNRAVSGPGQQARPREVTIAGVQTIVGSVLVLLLLVSLETQLNTSAMQDELEKLLDDPRVDALGLTVDKLRTMMHYVFMVMGVLAVTSMVLGLFVLRRHGASRIVLTVMGGLVAMLSVLGGPGGWFIAAYVGMCLFLLWTKPARAWFKKEAASMPGWPGDQPPASGGPGSWPPPPPPPPRG